jgi:hypothetical protein
VHVVAGPDVIALNDQVRQEGNVTDRDWPDADVPLQHPYLSRRLPDGIDGRGADATGTFLHASCLLSIVVCSLILDDSD